ncbi:conserved hypothetical protein [Ricinus communis]|uniref:Uncharacterized protein n=1 Tax=Ricinus communis TaxID=3988 RepID=B9RWY4_RICCO|nr:conserved hypothetical protein [Ricinus communis]
MARGPTDGRSRRRQPSNMVTLPPPSTLSPSATTMTALHATRPPSTVSPLAAFATTLPPHNLQIHLTTRYRLRLLKIDLARRSSIGILNPIPWCIRGVMQRLAPSMVTDCASGGPRVKDQIRSEKRCGVAG